ncbi:MAG: hypothetical protein ABI775_00040 [Pseudonocardiales bacterium]|nr:hypothetical protein [Actinomycetota bacterium]
MDKFSGFEPAVGEIRALRSFRIGPDARLYPLFSDEAWSDGVNTARCRNTALARRRDTEHLVVGPDCTCGFYAYADEQGAVEYPHAQHVLAVVACWGRVVAGTRGLRSEHARVEAVWMSSTVPPDLAAGVAENYPAATTYADKTAMLAEHPPTRVDCYDDPSARQPARARTVVRAGLLTTLVLGLVPWRLVSGNYDALALWVAAVCGFLVAAVVYGRRAEVVARKRALICTAAVLWLVAPLAGPAGFYLFRLPVLQIAFVAYQQRRTLVRASRRFPADIG